MVHRTGQEGRRTGLHGRSGAPPAPLSEAEQAVWGGGRRLEDGRRAHSRHPALSAQYALNAQHVLRFENKALRNHCGKRGEV